MSSSISLTAAQEERKLHFFSACSHCNLSSLHQQVCNVNICFTLTVDNTILIMRNNIITLCFFYYKCRQKKNKHPAGIISVIESFWF